ncbi:MAG: chemotaxis-specific protein-glutamate methyltransferase CheB, partial [Paracoccaceae bacterium]
MFDDTIDCSRNQRPARVAIVDDSKSIRHWLRRILNDDPRLDVVAEAANGIEAREVLRNVPVDVVTLDVDMPGISGLDFLARLMVLKPMPVVMLSALTEVGSKAAIEALSLGAVDCIEKPKKVLGPDGVRSICNRVYNAANTRVTERKLTSKGTPQPPEFSAEAAWSGGVILLGASTGGVTALETVLTQLEATDWPVVIAQHMPENFLHSFCRRLNGQFSRRFYMASQGHELRSGQAVIALGKTVSTRLKRSATGHIICDLSAPSKNTFCSPNIDDLFYSAADAQLDTASALLTGMGSDGAIGLKRLRETGGYTFAQNESSCVVYGMPKAAVALGAAIEQLSDQSIGRRLATLTSQRQRLKNVP